jgi:hypothetical protein
MTMSPMYGRYGRWGRCGLCRALFELPVADAMFKASPKGIACVLQALSTERDALCCVAIF